MIQPDTADFCIDVEIVCEWHGEDDKESSELNLFREIKIPFSENIRKHLKCFDSYDLWLVEGWVKWEISNGIYLLNIY